MILRLNIIVSQEFETHQSIFCPDDDGFTLALNNYRAVIGEYNAADELGASPRRTPPLSQFIGGTVDPRTIFPVANAGTKAFAPYARFGKFPQVVECISRHPHKSPSSGSVLQGCTGTNKVLNGLYSRETENTVIRKELSTVIVAVDKMNCQQYCRYLLHCG